MELPEKTDNLFATVAFHPQMPLIVGLLFILGLISASYSSVASALTSLTTSYTIDILQGDKIKDEKLLKRKRMRVHASMAIIMIVVILGFYYLNKQDAISAVYTLASYSYGPILGLFAFGIISKRNINGKLIPIICLSAPILSWIIQWFCKYIFDYDTGFELLLINAFITFIGLTMLPNVKTEEKYDVLPQIASSKN